MRDDSAHRTRIADLSDGRSANSLQVYWSLIMRLRDIGWLIGVPLIVTAAALFLCTENFLPTPHYYWALFR
ncbi:hypothetical protein [Actimicrobium antarcticum]|uniref:Uncharacterized protein n=1 Tax=Actimicrobium antarcticum TaxID=1051899 RepID=A0ABP7T6Q5_9BURK